VVEGYVLGYGAPGGDSDEVRGSELALCHPILTDGGIPLDAVRRLLAEGCSQMLGYLRLPVQLKGRGVMALTMISLASSA
jgi:hypothetical protein